MRGLIRSLCIVLLSLAVPALAADKFTFIHITDIHVGAQENHQADAALFKEMAALKPSFVVNTGDVCEHGTDAQYELYRETLQSLGDIPSYVAPGNHDVRWNPRGKEGYTLGTKQPLNQSWDHGGIHFVLLDSTVLLEHWGHISQDQLDWLKKDLDTVGPDKPVVIGFHHPIAYDSVMVDNEQALIDLTAGYNVVLFLQGHGHADIQWSIDGALAIEHKGLYQGSYGIIESDGQNLIVSRRVLDGPPKTGELKGKTVPIATIPLAKQPRPEWAAAASREGDTLKLTASPGQLPQGTTFSYRIEAGKLQPMDGSAAAIPLKDLLPGRHVAQVAATLPDKRILRKSVTVEIPGPVAPKWDVNVGGAIQSRLVRSGDKLYISSMGGDLVALNAADGKEAFRVKADGPVFCESHVADGIVYFGSADHFVYAADASTGQVKWKTQTGGAVLGGPNLAKGVVCVGSTDAKIYGLDAADGKVRWTVPMRNMVQTKTATDGDKFFVGSWDNHFRCIDAETGKVLWDLALGKPIKNPDFSPYAPAITSPAVGDGKVLVSTNDGILHALHIADGSEAWRIDWKKMGYSSPLYKDGKVYCALSDEGKTFCVDAENGDFIWQAETGSVIYDSSFAIGGAGPTATVFIGNVNGTANAIDAATGKLLYQYRLGPGHLLGSPAADENAVYIGNMTGRLVALPLRP